MEHRPEILKPDKQSNASSTSAKQHHEFIIKARQHASEQSTSSSWSPKESSEDIGQEKMEGIIESKTAHQSFLGDSSLTGTADMAHARKDNILEEKQELISMIKDQYNESKKHYKRYRVQISETMRAIPDKEYVSLKHEIKRKNKKLLQEPNTDNLKDLRISINKLTVLANETGAYALTKGYRTVMQDLERNNQLKALIPEYSEQYKAILNQIQKAGEQCKENPNAKNTQAHQDIVQKLPALIEDIKAAIRLSQKIE